MKTVLITGANRGIGYAAAKKFLDGGYRVVGTSRSGKIDIDSKDLEVITLDLTKPESIKKATEEIKSNHDKIDILVNNAGISTGVKDRVDIVELRKVLEVNLIGLADFTEQLIPLLSRGGHIVNISSDRAAITGNFGVYNPSYSISKVALNMYTKSLGSRLKNMSITVSSLDPGWVKTDMGGAGASREPEEAAEDVFNLATSDVDTGFFWLRGKKRSW